MTKQATSKQAPLGAFSETGKLRTVLTCRPGLAHQRLTPSNCDSYLFDDVFWVQQAKSDHHDFSEKMKQRGVEVIEMHELLADILAEEAPRQWIFDRKFTENHIGIGMMDELTSWLKALPPEQLAEFLVGGITVSDVPFKTQGMFGLYLGSEGFITPPLPNLIFTRDIIKQKGVTVGGCEPLMGQSGTTCQNGAEFSGFRKSSQRWLIACRLLCHSALSFPVNIK